MTTTITNLHFGKVRNSAVLSDGTRILHTTNRISAFDCILPFTVPGKAEILQALSLYFFNHTGHIAPNHLIGCLNGNHLLVKNAKVFPLEVVVRRYLTGSLWRLYESKGAAEIQNTYGVLLPSGLHKNARLPEPIITPTSKADAGHDEPVTLNECSQIISKALEKWNLKSLDTNSSASNNVTLMSSDEIWQKIANLSLTLFKCGETLAQERELILVDTKYEWGWLQNELILVDEIHTPDSSRYWIASDQLSENPKQLSKEFLREEILNFVDDPSWLGSRLAEHPKFQNAEFCKALAKKIANRYAEMFEKLTSLKSTHQLSLPYLVPWPLPPAYLAQKEENLEMPKRILICGNGGREFALACYFEQFPEVNAVYIAPADRHWISEKIRFCEKTNALEIAQFAAANEIGLVVVGPENYIAQGIQDHCKALGIPVLAPSTECAALETSKILCKKALLAADISTPKSQILTWTQLKQKLHFIVQNQNCDVATLGLSVPCVLKYDGLASGKGVVVAQNTSDLCNALNHYTQNIEQWWAQDSQLLTPSYSKEVNEPSFLIEECIAGEEISVIALCNGTEFRLFPFARDYKRRNDFQQGPNTGGMGTVCPVEPQSELLAQASLCFERILNHMNKQKTPFHGFLFAGFMVDSKNKAWLLEFNCRLGDPETQVILPGLSRECATEILCTARGEKFSWSQRSGTFFEHDGLKRVYVVGAAPEYPDQNPPRRLFESDKKYFQNEPSVTLVPTAINANETTIGGRAFGILAQAKHFHEARKLAYAAMSHCHFRSLENKNEIIKPHFRNDIALELQ